MQGARCAASEPQRMAMLRGKGRGLEIALGGRELESALHELREKLGERPGFYAGTAATASLGSTAASREQIEGLRELLTEHGISLQGIRGDDLLEPLAAASGLRFEPAVDGGEELARRRAMRPKRELELSDAARSLIADFAGARSDIAQRRRRGEASVRRVPASAPPPAPQPLPFADSRAPLYHVGTLRGGQSLAHAGDVVVVGDVNPGAEIVAGGDIAVFGALRGVAHAGAQGDEAACVHALTMAPTQLRIATFIAADAQAGPKAIAPETAYVHERRIALRRFDPALNPPRGEQH